MDVSTVIILISTGHSYIFDVHHKDVHFMFSADLSNKREQQIVLQRI
jgi:hypothetical protein